MEIFRHWSVTNFIQKKKILSGTIFETNHFFRDNFGSNGSDEDSARAMKLALELHALGLGGTESESEEDEEDLAALAPPKKSQNTTEVITVPSSEHVAEIVGKQGKYYFRT